MKKILIALMLSIGLSTTSQAKDWQPTIQRVIYKDCTAGHKICSCVSKNASKILSKNPKYLRLLNKVDYNIEWTDKENLFMIIATQMAIGRGREQCGL